MHDIWEMVQLERWPTSQELPECQIGHYKQCLPVSTTQQVPGLYVHGVDSYRQSLTGGIVLDVWVAMPHSSGQPRTDILRRGDSLCPLIRWGCSMQSWCGVGCECAGVSVWGQQWGVLVCGRGESLWEEIMMATVDIPVPQSTILRTREEIVGVRTIKHHLPNCRNGKRE